MPTHTQYTALTDAEIGQIRRWVSAADDITDAWLEPRDGVFDENTFAEAWFYVDWDACGYPDDDHYEPWARLLAVEVETDEWDPDARVLRRVTRVYDEGAAYARLGAEAVQRIERLVADDIYHRGL